MEMLLKLKRLTGDSFIYGLSGIINRFIGIFLVPIYTKIFTPSDYGVINLVNTTFYFFGMIAISGMDNSFFRWFYDSENLIFRKKVTATWFWYQFSTLLLILILAILFNSSLSLLLFEKRAFGIYFAMGAATMFFSGFGNILTNWFRVRQKPYHTVFYSLFISLINIGLSILFVVILKKGLYGVFSALLIGSIVTTIISFIQLKDWVSIKNFNYDLCKKMLRFGLPLIPAAIAIWLLNSSATYFIQFLSNQNEVGLFSVGLSLGSSIFLLTGAFQQAWSPFAFSIINDSNAKEIYANVLLWYTVIVSMAVLLLFIFSREILITFTQPLYYEADWTACLVGVNFFLIGYGYVASLGVGIAKKNRPYAIGVLIGSSITLLLFFILIPNWGKSGAAMAMILGQLTIPIIVFKYSQLYYPIPYKFLQVIIFFTLTILFAVLGKYYLDSFEVKTRIFYKLIFISFVFSGLYFFFIRGEIKRISKTIL